MEKMRYAYRVLIEKPAEITWMMQALLVE